MQRAQPVLLSHHLLAYVEMFGRDRERLTGCRQRINILPLGAAALAGTGLPIDRQSVAEELGFAAVTANSMDTTGDRDFALEFLFCLNLIQLHLSRLAEELVLWSSKEFEFVRIGDRYCTGSSIMPQKKNPDIPELIRGKTGRVTGALMALLMTVKGCRSPTTATCRKTRSRCSTPWTRSRRASRSPPNCSTTPSSMSIGCAPPRSAAS